MARLVVIPALLLSLATHGTALAQTGAGGKPAPQQGSVTVAPDDDDAPPRAAVPADAEGDAPPELRLPPSDMERAVGLTVRRIDVVGNARVAEDDVLTYLRSKVGQPFQAETLTNDVRALWDSGFFDDIQVDLGQTTGGVTLRFVVRERPNIKAIEFEGNDELDNEKLLEVVELKLQTSLSIPAVRRSVQKIKDAYEEKGYFLADVSFVVDAGTDNEVTVKFKVAEHQPVTVRRINFLGNVNLRDEELREVMATAQSSFFSFGAGGSYKQDILERDVLMISALYYDRGFLNVQVGTPRVMLTPDREGIEITLTIHEGPRYRIRQMRIYERDQDGNEVEPLGGRRALRQMIKSKAGDYFNRAELVDDLQAVRTLYRDAGYANVEAEPETDLDPVKKEVDLVLPIRRGPLVTVERIEIKGNTKTRDKVLRREMEIEEGQLFSESKLELSKARINALGYFERVDMTTEQGSAPDKIVINFEITERPTGTFQLGAGFSSIENFILTAQVQQANLLGSGQSLAFQAQVSSLRRLVSLRFFEPYFFGTDWNFSTELFNQLYVFPDFSRNTLGGSLTFGYALIQPWLRLSLTGTAQHDQVDTGQVTTFFGNAPSYYTAFSTLPLANLFNAGRTISLRPAITYDTRNNRLFPTSGMYLLASTEYANQATGSQIEFMRHRANFRFYIPLGGQTAQPGSGFVLKANTEVGVITSPNPEGVPIFARYFLGGILDVRGYRLRTLGPRLPLNQSLDVNAPPIANGANFGGNLQAYANMEFEFPIIDKVGIRGVAFYDIGNSWNLESQYCKTTPAPQFSNLVSPCWDGLSSMQYVRMAAGGGIRWFSPLGPLRFELGFPINKLSWEQSSVFEFTIGNFF